MKKWKIGAIIVLIVIIVLNIGLYLNPKEEIRLIYSDFGSYTVVQYTGWPYPTPKHKLENSERFNISVYNKVREIEEKYPGGVQISCDVILDDENYATVMIKGTATANKGETVEINEAVETGVKLKKSTVD